MAVVSRCGIIGAAHGRVEDARVVRAIDLGAGECLACRWSGSCGRPETWERGIRVADAVAVVVAVDFEVRAMSLWVADISPADAIKGESVQSWVVFRGRRAANAWFGRRRLFQGSSDERAEELSVAPPWLLLRSRACSWRPVSSLQQEDDVAAKSRGSRPQWCCREEL